MRLGVIFVITLAVSVIVSSVATWGLTFSTSHSGLQDMSSSFIGLATVAVTDFGQLVQQLINDSGLLVANILETEHQRTMTQMNDTGLQFLQTTMDLMARARNNTAQAQNLATALVVSFGDFMQLVISDFKDVDTDYASRLRSESASRTQAIFSNFLQGRVFAIERQARQYELGFLSFSRLPDQPLDDSSCVLMGSLCAASLELQSNVYVGTAGGSMMLCDINDVAYTLILKKSAAMTNFTFLEWPPYGSTDATFPEWKASCIAGSNVSFLSETCPNGTASLFPGCDESCGYDPRCRPWYTVHTTPDSPQTKMSDVYIDVHKAVPVVSISYPIYSGVPRALVAVASTDFYFTDVDKFLNELSVSQLVAVIFNSSDLLVVGVNRDCGNATAHCHNATKRGSGVPINETCHPQLRALGRWLVANHTHAPNVSLELGCTLWEVFTGTVESFSYFVAVGMNKTEVYAVITSVSQTANDTLRMMSQQKSDELATLEASTLSVMETMFGEQLSSLQALQAEEQQHMKVLQNQTAEAFNASRMQSEKNLSLLISNEMDAINELEGYHLSHVVQTIGVTFGAATGVFAVILLLGAYGTWVVTKQVHRIAQVMEDVAHMRVEQLAVSPKSAVREVQRIEAALGVLVLRLAEYKSYMPAGLFQVGEKTPPEQCSAPSSQTQTLQRRNMQFLSSSLRSPVSSGTREVTFSELPAPACEDVLSCLPGEVVCAVPVPSGMRLARRSVAVAAINAVRFHTEMVQRTQAQLEDVLNRLISTVHTIASKAQGNLDAVVGDQLLVTFNAHFRCHDPPTAASNVALDVIVALREEPGERAHVQIGLAAGQAFAGHLGCANFKSMVALGSPLKVASMLSHLSGFNKPVVLVCPSMEERIKFQFSLQPADLVALPRLGAYVPLYSKSICVFILEGRVCTRQGSQEWLYQVSARQSPGCWTVMFGEVARAPSVEKAKEDLKRYLDQHPQDRLARRLFDRFALWQPRTGIVLAERPDASREVHQSSSSNIPLSLSL